MYEITLEDLQKELGEYKKSGGHYYFQCKYCLDEHKDNMIYTPSKNLIKCFADEAHSRQLLSEIMKKKHEEKKMSNTEIPKYIKNQEAYVYYQLYCNDMLLGMFNKSLLDEMFKMGMCDLNEYEEHLAISKTDKPLKALDYLYKSRGIKRETVSDCGIGIDFVAKRWVIPIFNLSGEIVGFEYRGLDFKNKQIKKEVGTPTCLARIHGALNSKKVIIVEGLLDGVVLSQLVKDSMIVSCSNGVQGTLKCLSQLQFSKYDEIKLILDNDKAGDTETEKIISQYPFIKDCRKFLIDFGAKDIGDWYMDKYVW